MMSWNHEHNGDPVVIPDLKYSTNNNNHQNVIIQKYIRNPASCGLYCRLTLNKYIYIYIYVYIYIYMYICMYIYIYVVGTFGVYIARALIHNYMTRFRIHTLMAHMCARLQPVFAHRFWQLFGRRPMTTQLLARERRGTIFHESSGWVAQHS